MQFKLVQFIQYFYFEIQPLYDINCSALCKSVLFSIAIDFRLLSRH